MERSPNNGQPVLLRAHHALCILHFIGKGYSEPFVRNMRQIIRKLEEPGATVRLAAGADAVCAACPNHTDSVCRQEPKPGQYDSRVLRLCGLRAGQVLLWRELEETARRHILEAGGLPLVCGGCGWLPLCGSL